jgi:spermidine synthase
LTQTRTVSLPVILGVFVLSGAAGLVYEVVWARQLVLVFGNTTQAVSAILTGFFGGMAIGSALGGRLADRVRRPLRMYGLLELLLVVVVILTPITFRLLHEVYRGAFGTLEANPGLLALVRFGLALLALGPATILMGATLPTLTRYLSRHADHLSEAFGELYAANTLGAIVGTIVAGFVLIELLGLTGTLLVGAACSALAGGIALVLDRRVVVAGRANPASTRAEEPDPESPAPAAADPVDPPLSAPVASRARRPISAFRLGILVAFVSGLTSLAYQTLWTRLLAAGTGNYTYVFTTILALFLIGIALGAVAFTVIRPWIRNTVGLLALAQLGTAVLVVLGAVLVIPGASTGILDMHGPARGLFDAFLRTSAVVVLPATFVMGLSFPAASALVAGSDREVGGRAGLLLAANTIGAIAGTFLIPFVVIPRIGSPDALALVAMVNAGLAIVLALWGGLGRTAVRAIVAMGGVAVVAVLAVAVATGEAFVDPTIARIERTGGTVQRSAEDEIASVQGGVDANGNKHLWVTGSSMTLLTVDAKLMPVLPLMARPDAKTAAVVAFGMGSAYRGALIAGLQADAVELVPSVPTMFGLYYDDAAAVLADPAGRVIIADGRNHIELTDQHYDIIVTDPPPPIESAGVSVISSREYYAAGRARLNPGGVMMQWIPWGQTLDEFLAHLRSFKSVFPEVLVAFGPGGYGLFMLGSDEPISFDPANVAAVLARPGVTEDLSSAYDSPEHTAAGWARRIPSLVWISGNDVARVVGDGPLITDDHPLPEYFLLRHMFGAQSPQVSPQLLLQLSASP